jgi:hypothetical protein
VGIGGSPSRARIGPCEIGAERAPDGSYVFSGLPHGTWPLRASSALFGEDTHVSGMASVRAGESVTIEVEEAEVVEGIPGEVRSK